MFIYECTPIEVLTTKQKFDIPKWESLALFKASAPCPNPTICNSTGRGQFFIIFIFKTTKNSFLQNLLI